LRPCAAFFLITNSSNSFTKKIPDILLGAQPNAPAFAALHALNGAWR